MFARNSPEMSRWCRFLFSGLIKLCKVMHFHANLEFNVLLVPTPKCHTKLGNIYHDFGSLNVMDKSKKQMLSLMTQTWRTDYNHNQAVLLPHGERALFSVWLKLLIMTVSIWAQLWFSLIFLMSLSYAVALVHVLSVGVHNAEMQISSTL